MQTTEVMYMKGMGNCGLPERWGIGNVLGLTTKSTGGQEGTLCKQDLPTKKDNRIQLRGRPQFPILNYAELHRCPLSNAIMPCFALRSFDRRKI